MTAVIMLQQMDAIHLVTDAAATDQNSNFIEIVPKGIAFPELNAAVCFRGNILQRDVFLKRFRERQFRNFGDVTNEVFSDIALMTAKDLMVGAPANSMRKFEAHIAGWYGGGRLITVNIDDFELQYVTNGVAGAFNYAPAHQESSDNLLTNLFALHWQNFACSQEALDSLMIEIAKDGRQRTGNIGSFLTRHTMSDSGLVSRRIFDFGDTIGMSLEAKPLLHFAVGGVDIHNLVHNAATKVDAYSNTAVNLTSQLSYFSVISTGSISYPVATDIVILASMLGNGGSSSTGVASEAMDITFSLFVDGSIVSTVQRTYSFIKIPSGGGPYPPPNFFDMVLIGKHNLTAGNHTIEIRANYIRFPEGVTDSSSYCRTTSTQMIVTQNRR